MMLCMVFTRRVVLARKETVKMELRTCKGCGRTFAAEDDRTLCKRCYEANMDNDFKLVRDYLYEHPGSDIAKVASETGVSESVILKLLRQDRIEVVDEVNSVLRCEKCGVSIKSGRFCDKCKKEETMKQMVKTRNEMRKEIKDEEREPRKRWTYYHSR